MPLARNATVAAAVATSVGASVGKFVAVELAVAGRTAIVAKVELAVVDSVINVDAGSKLAACVLVGVIVFVEISVGHRAVVKAVGLSVEDMVRDGERANGSCVARVA